MKRISGIVALGLSALLVFSACFGGGKDSASGEAKPIRIGAVEAKTGLIPGMVSDSPGGWLMRAIYAPLVIPDENGKMIMEVAESATTTDNINWVFKLKKDWKFTNGEPVTAHSYVDSWNYIANADHGQYNRDNLKYIEGYADDLKGDLTGLEVPDDYTIKVKLIAPINDFLERLSHTTFLPLPKSAYEDIEKFGKNPVGNGAYILKDRRETIGHKLVVNKDYKGYYVPKNGGYNVTIYAKQEAAYADYVAGNLDVISVPSNSYKTVKEDSQGRYKSDTNNTISYLPITAGTPGLGFDEAGKLRRRAISMAINRQEIIEKIYNGWRTAATGFLPPKLFPEYQHLPGSDVLKHNAAMAKDLWAKAEAISPYPKGQKLRFPYNSDSPHREWIEAVVNQLVNTLGLEGIEIEAHPTFAEYLKAIDDKDYNGFVRYGWIGDWGAPAGTLEFLFTTGANSNRAHYSNPEVDALMKEASTALSKADSELAWKKAQEILLQDLPFIPLWNSQSVVAWSEGTEGVKFDSTGEYIPSEVRRK